MDRFYNQRFSSSQPDIMGSDTNSSRVLVPQFAAMDPRNDGSFLIIDKTEKNFIIVLWVVLAIMLALGFIIVGKMPQSYLKITNSQSACLNPVRVYHNKTYECKDFDLKSNPKKGIMIKGLTSKNQHIILNAYFYFNDTTSNTLIDEKISLNQYEVSDAEEVKNHLFEEKFELTLDNYTLRNKFLTNESQTLGVKGSLFYQHNIMAKNMLIIAEFESLSEKSNIRNITVEFLTINPQYTIYQRNIRIVFFFFSLVSLIAYFITQRNISESRKVVQHKLISYLTLFLIIFNNPLIAALQTNNRFLIFLLQFSFLLLPTALVFFWMSVFERGQKQNTLQQSKIQGNIHNWGIIFLIFIFQFAMYLVDDYNRLVDYVGVKNELASFVGLRYTCFFATLLGYVRIIYRMVNVFMKQQSLVRYRRLASLSIPIIVLSFLFFLTVQYNVYSTESKAVFLMVYLFNFYIYFIQILYSKSKFNNITFLSPVSNNIIVIPQAIHQAITIHEVPRRVEEKPKQNMKSVIIEMNSRAENQNQDEYVKQETKEEKMQFKIEEEREDEIKVDDQIGYIEELGKDLELPPRNQQQN